MLRRLIRYIYRKIQPKYLPRPTPWGFTFRGPEFLDHRTFEPLETGFVQRNLPDFGLCINIGANIGYYTCMAAQAGLHVMAVEPLPANVQLLNVNLHENHLSTVEVFPVAFGAEAGILPLYGSGTGASLIAGWAGCGDEAQYVPVHTVDALLTPRIDRPAFFIVDVEGAEHNVLLGARKLLRLNYAHLWLMEINLNEHQPAGVRINPSITATFSTFYAHGYVSSDLQGAPISLDTVAAWQRGESLPPAGVHNFVFHFPQSRPRFVK